MRLFLEIVFTNKENKSPTACYKCTCRKIKITYLFCSNKLLCNFESKRLPHHNLEISWANTLKKNTHTIRLYFKILFLIYRNSELENDYKIKENYNFMCSESVYLFFITETQCRKF